MLKHIYIFIKHKHKKILYGYINIDLYYNTLN